MLNSDLDFANSNTQYSAHSLHAFAAKFPPQIPRVFITELARPGETVLDPMMGSGTAVLEALLLGRKPVGFDIDPLAVRIGRVKTTPLDIFTVTSTVDRIVATARRLADSKDEILRAMASGFTPKTVEFFNYWFSQDVQMELMALLTAITSQRDTSIRPFLEVIFSSVIVTKSGGVSLARDLAHSRPHKVENKNCKSAIDKFAEKADKAIKQICNLPLDSQRALVSYGDVRRLPLKDSVVDLVVTSPPYVNAIDYVRAHKFSLSWLGYPIEGLTEKRTKYIGAEKYNSENLNDFPETVRKILQSLGEKDAKKAGVARKYFVDMKAALGEMHRVLKPRKAAIIVVGTSTIRDINVQTHLCLATLAEQVGFDLVDIAERKLDRNKRMMPARFGKQESTIELRMHSEYVIGLIKGSKCQHARKPQRTL